MVSQSPTQCRRHVDDAQSLPFSLILASQFHHGGPTIAQAAGASSGGVPFVMGWA
jgi:hypothetical protein